MIAGRGETAGSLHPVVACTRLGVANGRVSFGDPAGASPGAPGGAHTFHPRKGKPVARRGRKATGLRSTPPTGAAGRLVAEGKAGENLSIPGAVGYTTVLLRQTARLTPQSPGLRPLTPLAWRFSALAQIAAKQLRIAGIWSVPRLASRHTRYHILNRVKSCMPERLQSCSECARCREAGRDEAAEAVTVYPHASDSRAYTTPTAASVVILPGSWSPGPRKNSSSPRSPVSTSPAKPSVTCAGASWGTPVPAARLVRRSA